MLKAEIFQIAASRHAQFYLEQLRMANDLYQGSGTQTQRALDLFNEHWIQIQKGYQWAAENAPQLCCDYCTVSESIFTAQRPIEDHVGWLQTGICAAQIIKNPSIEARLLIRLGQAYLVSQNMDTSQQYYLEALNLSRQHKLTRHEGYALVGLGRVLLLTPATYEAARQHLETAVTLFEEIGDDRGRGWSLHNLGTLLERLELLENAQECLEKAYHVYTSLGDQRLIAHALNRLGSIYERQKAYQQAIRVSEQALVIGRAIEDWQVVSNSLSILGLVASFQGDLNSARLYYEESLTLTQRSGNKHQMAAALLNLGFIAEMLADFPAATRYYQESLDLCNLLGMFYRSATTRLNLVFVYLQQKRITSIRPELYDILQLCESIHAQDFYIYLATALAWLLLLEGQTQQGIDLAAMLLSREDLFDGEIELRLASLRKLLEERLSPTKVEQAVAYRKSTDFIPLFRTLIQV